MPSGVLPGEEVANEADGERKTVTALFADIKGSTEPARDLDPEEARAIVDPVLRLMMEAVHRYGGYVAQSTGDGIFALFGAPVAHEDHPQRALHAALAIQEELRRYDDRLRTEGKIQVEARVGVSTGEVVVRTIETGGHTEYTPVGHVTNLAARMHTAAPAGSIAASEATVTPHTTAAWTLQQPHEAIRSDHTYRFILHDRDLEGQTAAIEEFEPDGARVLSGLNYCLHLLSKVLSKRSVTQEDSFKTLDHSLGITLAFDHFTVEKGASKQMLLTSFFRRRMCRDCSSGSFSAVPVKEPLKAASTSDELLDLFEDRCALLKRTRPWPRQTTRAEPLNASP